MSYLVPRNSGISAEKNVGPLLQMLAHISGSHDDPDGRWTCHDRNRTCRWELKEKRIAFSKIQH